MDPNRRAERRKQRRAVITGMSVVTPIGVSLDEYWGNLLAGKCGFEPISHFDTSQYKTRIAGEVRDDLFLLFGDSLPKRPERIERVALMGLVASTNALKDANIDIKSDLSEYGVVFGSGIGGMLYYENQMVDWLNRGVKGVHPNSVSRITPNTVSSNIAIHFNCLGPDLTISTACSSSSHAIGIAYMLIKNGVCDSIITGGAEAPISPVLFAAFDNMRVMSADNSNPKNACMPFDQDRSGFVLSEGAAVLIIEELDHAIARGAHIYAEICGYGQSNGGHHMVIPAPDGIGEASAMERALAMGDIESADVDYIQAHGTGTIANDLSETMAIKRVFGEHASNIDISSTKGQTGHLLGASGALGCVTTALAISRGVMPPNSNLRNIDSQCNLGLVSKEPKQKKLHYALSNSFGFGNNNASILLKDWVDEDV